MFNHNSQERVAIFIDGENIHYSAKNLGIHLDYLKMCEYLADVRRLVRVHFYCTLNNESEGKIDFINFLKLNGFRVTVREIRDDVASRKGNLDVNMTVDAIEISSHVDTIIICSGDGDFTPLVQYLSRIGKHVELCALRDMTSIDLLANSDEYVDLSTIKDKVELERRTVKDGEVGFDYDKI